MKDNCALCLGAVIALAVLTLDAGTARAEHQDRFAGPYVSLYGGASHLEKAENTAAGAANLISEFDTGFVVGGAVGFYASSGFWHSRAELDVSYRVQDVDEVSVQGTGSTTDTDGDFSNLAFMANYWLDIENTTPVTPYFGGGIGLSAVSAHDVEGAGFEIDETDFVFAWQVGAGISWRFLPQWVLTADYRWFATDDPEFTASNGADFTSEYSSHNFMGGVRFDF